MADQRKNILCKYETSKTLKKNVTVGATKSNMDATILIFVFVNTGLAIDLDRP